MGVPDFWPRAGALASVIDLASGSCSGETWAVDSSVLMHAAIANPQNARLQVFDGVLAPKRAVATFTRALSTLSQRGVTPIAVFDGAPRPGKAEEVRTRKAGRQAKRIVAQQKLNQGCSDKEVSDAVKAAAHVTPELRYACICSARTLGVSVVVAPFEADGQLAQLYRSGRVRRVVTIDSDIGVLGCSVVRLDHEHPLSWMDDGLLTSYNFDVRVPRVPIPKRPPQLCLGWLMHACG